MKRIVISGVLAAIALVLFIAPILPTSAVFQLSLALYDEDEPERINLTAEDVEEILSIVASHDSFGHDPAIPKYLSAFEYLVSYRKFGFFGIGLMPLHYTEECPSCVAAVEYGMVCGSLCGAGTVLFFSKSDDTWVVRGESHWIS